MKRFAALTVALTLFAGLLAGCGSSKPAAPGSAPAPATAEPKAKEPEKVTIDFTYWAAAGGEEEAFKVLAEEFTKKYPHIKVNLQTKPAGDPQYHPQMENRIASTQAPDVFRVQYQQLGRYLGPGALYDLSGLIAKDLQDQIQPAFLKAVTYKGKLMAMPHHTDTLAIFYNQDYMDRIGVKPPTSMDKPWIWDEFMAVAQKLKEANLGKYPIAFNWSMTAAYRWLPFLYQNGGQLVNNDFTKSQVNTPEGVETLKWTLNMFKAYMSPGNSLKGTDKSQELFATGVSGLLVSGDWLIPYFDKNMKNYKWGVTYMPVKKGPGTDMGGNSLAVPKNARHPQEAAQFISFMMEKEVNKKFVQMGYFLPVRKDLDAASLSYTPHPDQMAKFVQQVTVLSSHAAQTMVLPQFAKINAALADTLEAMFTQNLAPEQAAKDLDGKVNDSLK